MVAWRGTALCIRSLALVKLSVAIASWEVLREGMERR